MEYYECPILCKLSKKEQPLKSIVPVDIFTKMVEKNFDYEFNGESFFYPFSFPKELEDIDFKSLAIIGSSGSGKSTLLKEIIQLGKNHIGNKTYDNNKAIVSCFNDTEEAFNKLSAVGLNSLPVWCKPRNVLSVGEGFRADIAINLENGVVFDEFTSTIDRNVAKSTCNSIKNYIDKNNLKNIIFVSCHSDFIPFLQPDFVIDLDKEEVYDCRDACLGKSLLSKCTKVKTKTFGEYLGSITI